MKIKKYEAIYSTLSTFVFDEEGERHNIAFKGGINGNVKIGGNFVTSDENLQQAIESDKRFGKEFKLKETHVIGEKIQEPENDIEPKQDEVESTESEQEPKDGVTVIESVYNKQDARIYFRDEKGEVGMSNILSASAIETLCNKHNVSFPNLSK